jgi:hypothetical protein
MNKTHLNPIFSLLLITLSLNFIQYYGLANYPWLDPIGIFNFELVFAFFIIVFSRAWGILVLTLAVLGLILKITANVYFADPKALLFSFNEITFSLLWANRFWLLEIILPTIFIVWLGVRTKSFNKSRDTLIIVVFSLAIYTGDVLNGTNSRSPGWASRILPNIVYSTSSPILQDLLITKPSFPGNFVDSASGIYLDNFHNTKSLSKRNIILIVVESLGAPSLDSNSNYGYGDFEKELQSFNLLKRGLVPFHGSTTWSGIRERFGLKGTYPIPEDLLSRSLMFKLRREGYYTAGFHSYRGSMFNRSYWWPKEGFQEAVFMENRIDQYPLHFGVFTTLNDEEMLEGEIRRLSSNTPYFMYFLCSNTHFPTSENPKVFLEQGLLRLTKKIHLLEKEGILTNTDLIIVGDHAPPIPSKLFDSTRVPYWILRTKN